MSCDSTWDPPGSTARRRRGLGASQPRDGEWPPAAPARTNRDCDGSERRLERPPDDAAAAEPRRLRVQARPAGARRQPRQRSTIDFRNRVEGHVGGRVWNDDCVRRLRPGAPAAGSGSTRRTSTCCGSTSTSPASFDFPTSQTIVRRFKGCLHMSLDRYDFIGPLPEVKFDDPEETLTLPRASRSRPIWRGTGTRRNRITQEYSDYRRFVTGARIVRRRRHPVESSSGCKLILSRACRAA